MTNDRSVCPCVSDMTKESHIVNSVGGSINGTIKGAEWGMMMANNQTKIVPGHGPLGNKASLTKYRDVLVTIRDRVQKLKSAGKKVEEVVAAKPTIDFDAVWSKGFVMPNDFVGVVYNTL